MVIDPGTSTPETVTLAPSELALPETPDAPALGRRHCRFAGQRGYDRSRNPQAGGASRGLFACLFV